MDWLLNLCWFLLGVAFCYLTLDEIDRRREWERAKSEWAHEKQVQDARIRWVARKAYNRMRKITDNPPRKRL